MSERSELVPDPVTDPATEAFEAGTMGELDRRVERCTACPRLVRWREQVAREKRAAFRRQTYWGRPVPGFGDEQARIAVVGLAPAAHGANRTGRMFTGDRSGEVLYRALYDTGLASAPSSESMHDGLELYGVRITAPVRCAPPNNKPSPTERDTCAPWLVRELELLRPTLRVVLALGEFGFKAVLPQLGRNWSVPSPRPKFGHGSYARLPARDEGADLHLLGCYHVSQQNTFTGKLTPDMLCEVLERAKELAGEV